MNFRFQKLFSPLLVLIMVLELVGGVFLFPAQEAQAFAQWYNSDWGYRKEITIESDYVQATETNFPVLVSVTDTDLKQTPTGQVTQSDGGDILFTNSSGTKLDHEIEKYASSTGELKAWVEVDSLSSTTDTILYIYYGGPSTPDQWNATGTWDTNYKMVQHLEESPANDVAGHYDSTSNPNDGTPKNFNGTATSTTDGTGKIDGADVFDGTDDYINCGNDPSLNITDAITIEAWVKPADTSRGQIISREDGCGYENQRIVIVYSNNLLIGCLADGVNEQHNLGWGAWTVDVWQHFVMTFDGTNWIAYKDGKQVDSKSQTVTPDLTGTVLKIGTGQGFRPDYFNGTIDEVRISASARTGDWIKTEYNNQNNPGTFMSFSSQEEPVFEITPGTANLTGKSVSVSSQTTTGWLGDATHNNTTGVKVEDNRAGSPGWTATIQTSHFTRKGTAKELVDAGDNNIVDFTGAYDGLDGVLDPNGAFIVEIDQAGALGIATFNWWDPAGNPVGNSTTTAATVALSNGISVTFDNTNYSVGDKWSCLVDVFPYTGLTITPSDIYNEQGSLTGVTKGSSEALTGSGATSDSKTLMTATAGNGTGIYYQDQGLSLSIHANSLNGEFGATATLTVI